MQEADPRHAVHTFLAQTIVSAQHRIAAHIEINKYTGRDFSSLAYLQFNEKFMSKILADLLDPMGSHGQGGSFLSLFARSVLGNETLDCSHVSACCEAQCYNITNNQRRIDILLTGPDWVCAIENKPRACEQKDQLEAYAEHIKKMKKTHTFLVFLTPEQFRPASLYTEEYIKKYLRIWSLNEHPLKPKEHASPNAYPATSFFGWTQACKRHCTSEKLRYFIDDFENKVHNFVW